jgi:hypothetical protein
LLILFYLGQGREGVRGGLQPRVHSQGHSQAGLARGGQGGAAPGSTGKHASRTSAGSIINIRWDVRRLKIEGVGS